MDRTSVVSESEYQAAVAPRIRWVVLDQLPMLDDRADLVCGDHPIRSRSSLSPPCPRCSRVYRGRRCSTATLDGAVVESECQTAAPPEKPAPPCAPERAVRGHLPSLERPGAGSIDRSFVWLREVPTCEGAVVATAGEAVTVSSSSSK